MLKITLFFTFVIVSKILYNLSIINSGSDQSIDTQQNAQTLNSPLRDGPNISTTQEEEINSSRDEIRVTNNDVDLPDTFVEESHASAAKIASEISDYDHNLWFNKVSPLLNIFIGKQVCH